VCVYKVECRRQENGTKARTAEDDDTIFRRIKLLTPKSYYTPFSADITPKKLATLLTLSAIRAICTFSRKFKLCSLSTKIVATELYRRLIATYTYPT